MQVVCQTERAGQAVGGRAGLTAIPCCAGGVQCCHEVIGEELLGGVDNLPGGGDRGGGVPRPQSCGDERDQVDPAVAATGDQRVEVELGDPAGQPDYLVRVPV